MTRNQQHPFIQPKQQVIRCGECTAVLIYRNSPLNFLSPANSGNFGSPKLDIQDAECQAEEGIAYQDVPSLHRTLVLGHFEAQNLSNNSYIQYSSCRQAG